MKPITADNPEFRSEALEEALKKADVAGVAYALRNDKVIVPLLPVKGPPQVRVFRRGEEDKYLLLLFSSADAYVRMIPQETGHRVLPYTRDQLRDFIEQNAGVIGEVWFDVGSEWAMQSTTQDILDALSFEGDA